MKSSLALAIALRLVQTIPLPGVEGRIDHMAVDVASQRLFVAALGNNSVEVVDLRAGKRARSLTGFHEPQGLAYLSDTNQLIVASAGESTCCVLDGKAFERQYPFEGRMEDADNVRYDADAHRLYVGDSGGRMLCECLGAISAWDTRAWSFVGEIALPAHPESFQLEHTGQQIFVNIPGPRRIAVAGKQSFLRKASAIKPDDYWPIEARGNFPMALNEEHHRLFIGCREPACLLVIDAGSGKEIARTKIDEDTDDVFYGAKRNRIYISCGAGLLDVLDAGSFKTLERMPTASGARTSLFVPELNRLYLAVPHRGNQQAEVRVFEAASQ